MLEMSACGKSSSMKSTHICSSVERVIEVAAKRRMFRVTAVIPCVPYYEKYITSRRRSVKGLNVSSTWTKSN